MISSEQTRVLTQENVFNDVEQSLQGEERRLTERHYASSIAGCPRRAWFRLKNIPVTHKITIAGFFKMKMGNMIADQWAEWLEGMGQLHHSDLPPIMELLEKTCPQMCQDILAASLREERPYDINRYVRPRTLLEVPFRMQLPGLKYEIGARVDNIYTGRTMPELPRLAETKTSHSFRTKMIVDQGFIPLDYLLQPGLYVERYPELPAELHYFDRQSGYPYRFGLQKVEGRMMVQYGGFGKKGLHVSDWLNDMELMDFVTARLEWVESLLELDEPPGEIVCEEIEIGRRMSDQDKEHGVFHVIHIEGLSGHETWLPDEDYHSLCYPDGDPIAKKTANKIKYNGGFCPYCSHRGLCYKEIDHPLISNQEAWKEGSNPPEGS